MSKRKQQARPALAAAAVPVVLALAIGAMPARGASRYQQTNLVTDDQAALADEGLAPALSVDANLINPWGISHGPGTPLWVSNQVSGTSTLYDGAGAKQPLVVQIPGVGALAGPTGQVFNSTNSFALSDGNKGLFFFANLDGSVSGWNPGSGTTAQRVVPSAGGVYTGIALGSNANGDFMYVANNGQGRIDVFNHDFAPATLAGSFTDPNLPAGLAPFNVQNIGGNLYVTFAVPGEAADAVDLGSGLVDVFDTNGNLVRRLATGGPLASPWGLALAPGDFGTFSNALLVGNFNDEHGNINAFDLGTGEFLGTLRDTTGQVISLPDLWGLTFGNDGPAGAANQLFFAAGIGDEEHGLLGRLEASAVNEPHALGLSFTALLLVFLAGARGIRAS